MVTLNFSLLFSFSAEASQKIKIGLLVPLSGSNKELGQSIIKAVRLAVKNINNNFKFDITSKKLNQYPLNGKFDFIISSFAKNCGHSSLKENYKCNYYKPLISNNLIN